MKINKRKIEVMMVSRESDEMELRLDGAVPELLENFNYLWVVSNDKCNINQEIND